MASPLRPLGSYPAASRSFARRALDMRAQGNREPDGWAQAYEERLAAGSVNGRLYVVDGAPAGLVSWSTDGPLGIFVNILYASSEADSAADYARILSAVEGAVGPVAFVAGPLAGLTPKDEDQLMRRLGFRRFARSEMVLAVDVALPEPSVKAGDQVRPVERSDLPELAELHRRAYRDRFDRYLFLEALDEREDALRGVGQILDGRWGEFVPAGSWVCRRDGRLAGATLSVHTPAGALVADVMVDPELQGNGVGRRVLTTALRSLRRAGEQRIYLNVTEGNEPALRLYRALGFVRSLGPTRDWYNAARIPVAPSPDA